MKAQILAAERDMKNGDWGMRSAEYELYFLVRVLYPEIPRLIRSSRCRPVRDFESFGTNYPALKRGANRCRAFGTGVSAALLIYSTSIATLLLWLLNSGAYMH